MIQIRTSVLATIARELDAAMDALKPTDPAFANLNLARGLFNIHLIHRLPEVEVYTDHDAGLIPEPGYETDAAGTYTGH